MTPAPKSTPAPAGAPAAPGAPNVPNDPGGPNAPAGPNGPNAQDAGGGNAPRPTMQDVGNVWNEAMQRVMTAGLGSGPIACAKIDFAGYSFTDVKGLLLQSQDPNTGETVITLKDVTAHAAGGTIHGTLEMRQDPATGAWRYVARDVAIANLDLAQILQPFGAQAILGVVSGKVTISGDSNSRLPRVEGRIELEKASFHGIFLELVSARVLIDPVRGQIELQQLLGTGYRGDLKGSLKIDLPKPGQSGAPKLMAQLLFEGFDIAAMAHDLGQGGSRINGSLAGNVKIQADLNTGSEAQTQGQRVKNLRITGTLNAAPLAGPGFTLQDISGDLSVDLDRNKLEINGLQAGAYGGRVQGLVNAKWTADSYSYQVALDALGVDLKDLFVDITHSRVVRGGRGQGTIVLTGSSAANGGKGGLERVRGQFRTTNFEMGTQLFVQDMAGWLAWDDSTQTTRLTHLTCKAYGGEFDGEVKLVKPEVGDLQTSLDGSVVNMDLGSLNAKFGMPNLEVEGQATGALALKSNGGILSEFSVDAHLRRAIVRQVRIDSANLTADLAPPEDAQGQLVESGDMARELNFCLSDAHAYDGVLRMIGQIDVDAQGQMRRLHDAQLKLSKIQIRDLLDDIGFGGGGKRELDVNGHCDAVLTFSEDFDDPSSRLGQGHLQITNGKIIEFPQAILLISRFSLDRAVFTALDANFEIEGDVLNFISFDLIDQNSKIKFFMDQAYGQGSIDSNGFIGSPFFMKWEYPKSSWTEWPIIGWLYFVREYANAMIVGSLGDPHIQDWPSAGILDIITGETVRKQREKHSVQYHRYENAKSHAFMELGDALMPKDDFWKSLH
ncbi:MAG: hypothetical protein ACREJ2_05745 [Planctomycetota bacterium]